MVVCSHRFHSGSLFLKPESSKDSVRLFRSKFRITIGPLKRDEMEDFRDWKKMLFRSRQHDKFSAWHLPKADDLNLGLFHFFSGEKFTKQHGDLLTGAVSTSKNSDFALRKRHHLNSRGNLDTNGLGIQFNLFAVHKFVPVALGCFSR